jgi:hypothetical protein
MTLFNSLLMYEGPKELIVGLLRCNNMWVGMLKVSLKNDPIGQLFLGLLVLFRYSTVFVVSIQNIHKAFPRNSFSSSFDFPNFKNILSVLVCFNSIHGINFRFHVI